MNDCARVAAPKYGCLESDQRPVDRSSQVQRPNPHAAEPQLCDVKV